MCCLYLFLLLLVTPIFCENLEKSFDEQILDVSFDERQTNCRVLTGTDFTDLGNGSVIFQGQTLTIIGNTSNGDPIVCPPTLQTFFNPTIIFKLPAIIFLPLGIIVNILTIVCYEVLKCSAKKPFTLFDSTIINYVVTLLLSNFLLLVEGAAFPSTPSLLYCEHIAFFLHFFILAQFFAFACAGVELARVSIQKRLSRRKERILLVIYLAVTWVVPFLLVFICLAINFSLRRSKVLYGITANRQLKCWMNQFEFILGFFAVPMFLVLIFVPITIGIQVLGTFLRFQARRRRKRAKKQRRTNSQSNNDIGIKSLSSNSIFDFFAAINANNERRRKKQVSLVDIYVSQKQQIISVIAYIIAYICLILTTVFILVNIFSSIEAISIRGVHTLILFQVVICPTMLVIGLANDNVRKSIKSLFRSKGRRRKNRRERSTSSSSSSDRSSFEDSSDSESSSDSEDSNKRRRRANEVSSESEDEQREERRRRKGRKQREAFTDEDDKRRKGRSNKVTSDDQREEGRREGRRRDKKKREDFTDDDENNKRRKRRTNKVSSETDDDQRENNRKRDRDRKQREAFTDENKNNNERKKNRRRDPKSEEDKQESNTNQSRATAQIVTAEIEPTGQQQQQLNNPGQFSYTLPNTIFPPPFQLQTSPLLNQGNIRGFPTINLPTLTNYLPPIQGVPPVVPIETQRPTSTQGIPPVVPIETQRLTSIQGVSLAADTQRPTSIQGVSPVVAIETQRPQGIPPVVAIETQRPISTQGIPPVVAIETQRPSRVPTSATSTQIPTSQLRQPPQTTSTSQEVALPSLFPTLLQSTTLAQNPFGISATTLNDIVHTSGVLPSQGGKPITIEDTNEEESLKSHSSPSLN